MLGASCRSRLAQSQVGRRFSQRQRCAFSTGSGGDSSNKPNPLINRGSWNTGTDARRGNIRGGQNRRGGRGRGRGGYNRNLPYKDPETGLFEGGPLKIMFRGQKNQGLVPLALRDEMYNLHVADPKGKGDIVRIANITGLTVKRVQACIRIREYELSFEKNVNKGKPLDRSIDELFQQYFGTRENFKNDIPAEELRARMKMESQMFYVQHPDSPPAQGTKPFPTSFSGRYKFISKKNPRQGETILKQDEKFLFLQVKKKDRFQKSRKKLFPDGFYKVKT